MNVFDWALPKPGHQITSGAEVYFRAVVAQVKPFVLVSEWGDMAWFHQKAEDFVFTGPATESARAAVQARMKKEAGKLN